MDLRDGALAAWVWFCTSWKRDYAFEPLANSMRAGRVRAGQSSVFESSVTFNSVLIRELINDYRPPTAISRRLREHSRTQADDQ